LLAQSTEMVKTASGAAKGATTSAWLLFVLLVSVFVLPFVLGAAIGRLLQMKNVSLRVGVCLLTVALALAPFGWRVMQGRSMWDALRMGIDLAGGANLIFQVDTEKAAQEQKQVNSEVMQRLIGAISRRLDPAAQEQITVRQVGSDRIEVIIPGADREIVEQKKKQMTRLGTLEFAILANRRKHGQIIREAMASPDPILRQDERVIAAWREVGWVEGTEGGPRHQKDVHGDSETAEREVERNGRKVRELLVVYERPERRVTGQYLTRAYSTVDRSGLPAVGFTFNQRGAALFGQLTSDNAPSADGFQSRLSILLDDQIHSAPAVREPILDGSGIIEGRFTRREIDELINVLNAGALEVPLVPEPISELTISPTLGLDVQKKGMLAIVISSTLVYVFMLIYYRFCGLVADICLTLNLVLLFGAMAVIDSAFTLPGLAGIALTVGMAVDSNVLIYERMREELERGSSLRMAIQNGFDRALSAIVDSNVTTLITAVILYMIGTDQIRGFAVTLFIGLVVSMFTVLYFGRLIFEIAEKKRWIHRLKMMKLMGKTDIDFIGKQRICWAISAIVIVGGLACFLYRGEDNYDVDLSGGTMVTFEFNDKQNIEHVRSELQRELGSISLERLTLAGERQVGDEGRRFRVRTKEQDINQVRQRVARALADEGLHRITMKVEGPIETISAPKSAAGPNKEGTETVESGVDASKFAGGHKVRIAFSDEITTATAHDNLLSEFEKLPASGGTKYEQPGSLFELVGLEGSGTTAGEYQVKHYSEMELKTTPAISKADLDKLLDSMQQTMASSPAFDEVNSFEGGVAAEMKQKAILAMLASFIAIVVYLWFRFEKIGYGLATILAVVHDCLVCLGMLSVGAYLSRTFLGSPLLLEDFKIDLNVIAAFMTIAGYSLNDTIVVFDRLREIKGKNPVITPAAVNLSINQTLSRTLLTSWTVFLVVFVLYVWGGESLHGFAYVLFVGMITGVYSTVYIASPAVLWLSGRAAVQPARRPSGADAAAVVR
jgi:SecD/SecF fusion protein